FLGITPEPNMPWQYAERLAITKAVDDRGQTLTQPEPYVLDRKWIFGMDGPMAWDAGTGDKYVDPAVDLRTLLVRLTCGKLPSQRLQEVRGVLWVRLLAVRPAVTVDDVLKAAGKTVPAARGGELHVVAVQADGDRVEVIVQLRGFPLLGERGQ